MERLVRTKVENFTIGGCSITCAVPQGSVLGPILYLLYTNNLEDAKLKERYISYAGDTAIVYADKDRKRLEDTINTDMKMYTEWLIIFINKQLTPIKQNTYISNIEKIPRTLNEILK